MHTRFILIVISLLILAACSDKDNKTPNAEGKGQNVLSLPKDEQEKYNKQANSILADFSKVLDQYSVAMVNAKTSKEAADLLQKSYDSFITFAPRMKMMDSLYPNISSMDSTNAEVQSHLQAYKDAIFRYNEAVNDLHILFGKDPEYQKLVKEMEERNKKPLN